jgi:hypothetical protein
MATKKIYASELGKCLAQDGNYCVYSENGMNAIYYVAPEIIWNEDNTDLKIGNKLEAVHIGYIADLDNFNFAINEFTFEEAK